MRSSLTLVALGAFGCSAPTLDMSLEVPQQMPANFDLSCVTSIWTETIGEDDWDLFEGDYDDDCIDVSGLKNYDDVKRAMSGQFTLDMPDSPLAAISVYGGRGSCDDDLFHDAIFYGGVVVSDNNIPPIKLDSNLSCSAYKPYNVRVIDLLQLSSTKQCTPVGAGRVHGGNVRKFPFVDGTFKTFFEAGDSANSTYMNGITTVEAATAALPSSTCSAVSYFLAEGGPGGTRCIEDTVPTLCGTPGDIELPIIALDFAGQSRDQALFQEYGQPVIGVAFEASTAMMKTPIANATVTLDDPSQGKVVYVEKGATRFNALATNATNADGFFLVYLKGAPTTITVTSPLHRAQRYKIASPYDYPSTLIAALTR